MKTTRFTLIRTTMKSNGLQLFMSLLFTVMAVQLFAGGPTGTTSDDLLVDLMTEIDEDFNSLHESAARAHYEGYMFLSCVHQTQISISELGYSVITPSMIVTNPEDPISRYEVDIVGPLTDTVTCAEVGEFLMVKVIDTQTGNSCWAWALIEDKFRPQLECGLDTLPCNTDLDELNFEDLLEGSFDNCTAEEDLIINFTYERIDYTCHPNFAGELLIDWTVEDEQGNVGTCEQRVLLEKAPIDSVMFPADITVNCPDANTDPSVTGEPTIFGEPFDSFCGFVTFITDETAPGCGDQSTITRTFMVMDWCTNFMIIGTQDITVQDTVPPVITCPEDMTVGTDTDECEGSFILPSPAVSDLCSDDANINVTARISGEFGTFEPGEVVTLDTGTFIITYTATDICNNSVTCDQTLRVVDDQEPTLVCNNLSFSLDDNGRRVIGVDPFADFYEDNCGTANVDIRRMVDPCGVPDNTEFGNRVTFCCEDVGPGNMVQVRVRDAEGNELFCMVEVTITDDTDPIARCRNIVVALDASGQVQIDADDIDNGSTDACGIADLDLDRTDFDCDDVGTSTTVTLTVTDENGNTDECTASVSVIDTISPQAVCRDITVSIGADGMVMITPDQIDAGSSDNCDDNLELSLDQETFTCDDTGDNTVTLTVTDPDGNTDECTATVTVEDDDTPTCVTRDITVQLDSDGMVSIDADDVDNGSNDGCGEIMTMVVVPSDFDCDNIGDNTVTFTITDDSGNSSVCTAVVTVEDDEAPECSTQDITVSLDEDGMVTITPEMVDDMSSDNCEIVEREVTPSTFTCDESGANIVTFTVTDDEGNQSSCTAVVTVIDDVPPVAICNDITVEIDENGLGTITADQADGGSTDNCEIASIVVTPTQFSCADLGTQSAVLTVMDGSGSSATCDLEVVVIDNIDPIARCQDITVSLGADGTVTIDNDAVDNGSTDNCDDDLSYSTSPRVFTCDELGSNTVILTVTDDSGNSNTCEAVVFVDNDTEPIARCRDITVTLDATGNATIDFNDVDGGSEAACDDFSFSVTPSSFTCDDAGTSVEVTVAVFDADLDTSTCISLVTVLSDNDPIALCRDVTVMLDADGNATVNPGDVNNGSSVTCGLMGIELDITEFDCDNLGDNDVVLTVSDGLGNSATCDATVTVEDNINPVAECDDITVQLDAAGNASISAADVDGGSSDNCSVMSISVTPEDFTCDNLGENTVVLTVTDQSGNTNTCEATVTVEDNIDPVAVCRDITVSLGADGTVTIDAADVDLNSNDNCDDNLELSIDEDTFDCGDVGIPQTVTLTVTDDAGNTDQCTAIVTVEDDGMPVAECQDITVQLDADGNASIVAADVDGGSSDPCGGTVEITASPTTFDCDDAGQDISVTLTVTDGSGNSSTCIATVTVEDNVDPVAVCQDITVQLDADGNATIVAADVDGGSTDNCDDDLDLSVNEDSFDCDDIGSPVTVTLTVTDDSGNSDDCTAIVTVEDNVDPVAICTDVTVTLVGGSASITAVEIAGTSTDNCTDQSDLDLSIDQSTFDCSDVGEVTVTATVTDEAGNSSTCTATVTVLDDGDPVITCPADQTVSCIDGDTDPSSYGNATATDACDVTVTVVNDIDLNECNIGTITRVFTATDQGGNTSSCTQIITFENTNPLIQADITCPDDVDLDDCVVPDPSDPEGGMPTIDGDADCFDVDITFSDETITDASGTRVERTFTITDNCQVNGDGSTGIFTCVQIFTGVDSEDPVISCPADVTVASTPEGGCDENFVSLPPATATDDNGIMSITNDWPGADSGGADASGQYPLGTTIVTFTATDECGNTSQCTTRVTVTDDSSIDFTCVKQIFQMEDDGDVAIFPEDGFVQFDVEGCMSGDTADFQFSFAPDINDSEPFIIPCDSLDDGAFSFQFILYIFEPNGDTTECLTGARVQDPTDICGTLTPGMIAGDIDYESSAIPDHTGLLLQSESDLESTVINDAMHYAFFDVARFEDYQVIPFNNEDHMEGVTALDIVRIRRHLHGYEPFETPYQFIAADVNNNNRVSATDLIDIRKLLLGYTSEFPNNTSWKFIPSEHEFDMRNPLGTEYPMFITIDPLVRDVEDADFMGVKIGDVNYDVGLTGSGSEWRSDSRVAQLHVPAMEWREGQTVELPIFSQISDLEGIQMTLDFHSGALELLDVQSDVLQGFSAENLGLQEADAGSVRLLWVGNDPVRVSEDEALIKLIFKAKRSGNSIDALRLGTSLLSSQAYTRSNEILDLEIGLKSDDKPFAVYQNRPNPFVDETTIRYYLPEDDKINLIVYDINGKMIMQRSVDAVAGENQLTINRSEINTTGILHYSLQTSFGTQTRKMTILD